MVDRELVDNTETSRLHGMSIAAIVMTANEAPNIAKCLASLSQIDQVLVLDSESTDGTIDIVHRFANANIMQVQWRGYASTLNEGIEKLKKFDWVLRIDADEELVGDLRVSLERLPISVSGLVVQRRIFFLGSPLRFGPHSNLRMLRVFRPLKGRCEATAADEHIIVDGVSIFDDGIVIIDRDNKSFSSWLIKHIRWAKSEARNVLGRDAKASDSELDAFNKRKRYLKNNVYYRCPPFFRAFMYFLYRFIFCLECLGGRNGISWCIFQGLWYRLLVDFYLWYPSLISEETAPPADLGLNPRCVESDSSSA